MSEERARDTSSGRPWERPEREPGRVPVVLEAVERAWRLNPNLRLGQLLVVAAGAGTDLFALEDDTLVEALERMVRDRSR